MIGNQLFIIVSSLLTIPSNVCPCYFFKEAKLTYTWVLYIHTSDRRSVFIIAELAQYPAGLNTILSFHIKIRINILTSTRILGCYSPNRLNPVNYKINTNSNRQQNSHETNLFSLIKNFNG